jgi:hypothetical protein
MFEGRDLNRKGAKVAKESRRKRLLDEGEM